VGSPPQPFFLDPVAARLATWWWIASDGWRQSGAVARHHRSRIHVVLRGNPPPDRYEAMGGIRRGGGPRPVHPEMNPSPDRNTDSPPRRSSSHAEVLTRPFPASARRSQSVLIRPNQLSLSSAARQSPLSNIRLSGALDRARVNGRNACANQCWQQAGRTKTC